MRNIKYDEKISNKINFITISEFDLELLDKVMKDKNAQSLDISLRNLGVNYQSIIESFNHRFIFENDQTTYFNHNRHEYMQKEHKIDFNFACCFFYYIVQYSRIPKEDEFVNSFVSLNKEFLENDYSENKDKHQIESYEIYEDNWNYRIKLAYSGFIREFYILTMLSDTILLNNAPLNVYYNIFLDVFLKIDGVLVNKNNNIYPLAIYLNSYFSTKNINRKKHGVLSDKLLEFSVNQNRFKNKISLPSLQEIYDFRELVNNDKIDSIHSIQY